MRSESQLDDAAEGAFSQFIKSNGQKRLIDDLWQMFSVDHCVQIYLGALRGVSTLQRAAHHDFITKCHIVVSVCIFSHK